MANKLSQRDIGGVTVESNIPYPGPIGRKHSKWPFMDMKVGDSFAISDEEEMLRVRTASSYAGSRNNMKFSIRKTYGTEEALYRCWRVE